MTVIIYRVLKRTKSDYSREYEVNGSLGLPLQCGDRLQSSEYDVCRRQILTSKIDPRTVGVKIFIMVVDP